MRVFVTGVGGQLGHDVMNELAKRGYEGVGRYGGHGGFDEKTATLSGSFKGRGIGDCWSGNAAVWDGKTFVRSEEHTTGSCKGFTGGAWLMPIFEARVER